MSDQIKTTAANDYEAINARMKDIADDEAYERLLKAYDAIVEAGASGIERLRMASRMISAYPKQAAAKVKRS